MTRKLLAGLASCLLLTSASACSGSSPVVVIKSYVIKDVERGGGPYTLLIDAYDNSVGESLHHTEEPVVGEYGPAAVRYPSGHRVDVTVRITIGGGKKIPLTSYIRLTDGGAGGTAKSCSPPNGQMSSLECSISTRF